MSEPDVQAADEPAPPPPWLSASVVEDGVRHDSQEAADHWDDQIWRR